MNVALTVTVTPVRNIFQQLEIRTAIESRPRESSFASRLKPNAGRASALRVRRQREPRELFLSRSFVP